jgi:hypothetical protein
MSPAQRGFDTAMRWMRENVSLAFGCYRKRGGSLAIDPRVRFSKTKGVRLTRSHPPKDREGYQMNSALVLLCCCYIDALGKVNSEGRKDQCQSARFQEFVIRYMAEFVYQSWCLGDKLKSFGVPEKHRCKKLRCVVKQSNYGTQALYKHFRCGFVHQFWPKDAQIFRIEISPEYWIDLDSGSHLGLNIDTFARGFLTGLEKFRTTFKSEAKKDPKRYAQFFEWLEA